jgi:hypothetical protein
VSAGRYKVQFTADATLKTQLELARDLLRHAVPSGDFGVIIGRALELLIDQLKKRRFGVPSQGGAPRSNGVASNGISPANAVASPPWAARANVGSPPSMSGSMRASGLCSEREPATAIGARPAKTAGSQPSQAARSIVTERDGLGCSWVGEDGQRCGSHAWLELDHHHPRAKGGSSEPQNLRWLCRNHNRLAAELEYGKTHIERAILRRHARRGSASPSR